MASRPLGCWPVVCIERPVAWCTTCAIFDEVRKAKLLLKKISLLEVWYVLTSVIIQNVYTVTDSLYNYDIGPVVDSGNTPTW